MFNWIQVTRSLEAPWYLTIVVTQGHTHRQWKLRVQWPHVESCHSKLELHPLHSHLLLGLVESLVDKIPVFFLTLSATVLGHTTLGALVQGLLLLATAPADLPHLLLDGGDLDPKPPLDMPSHQLVINHAARCNACSRNIERHTLSLVKLGLTRSDEQFLLLHFPITQPSQLIHLGQVGHIWWSSVVWWERKCIVAPRIKPIKIFLWADVHVLSPYVVVINDGALDVKKDVKHVRHRARDKGCSTECLGLNPKTLEVMLQQNAHILTLRLNNGLVQAIWFFRRNRRCLYTQTLIWKIAVSWQLWLLKYCIPKTSSMTCGYPKPNGYLQGGKHKIDGIPSLYSTLLSRSSKVKDL